MKRLPPDTQSRPGFVATRFAWRAQRAMAVAQIVLLVAVLGLVAALAISIGGRAIHAKQDAAKAQAAQVLNQYSETLFNAGLDLSAWRDAHSAIAALSEGFELPANEPGATKQEIKLKHVLNANDFVFVPGSATKRPLFAAKFD